MLKKIKIKIVYLAALILWLADIFTSSESKTSSSSSPFPSSLGSPRNSSSSNELFRSGFSMQVGFSTLVSVPIRDRPRCGGWRHDDSPMTESSSHSSSLRTACFLVSAETSSPISEVTIRSDEFGFVLRKSDLSRRIRSWWVRCCCCCWGGSTGWGRNSQSASASSSERLEDITEMKVISK